MPCSLAIWLYFLLSTERTEALTAGDPEADPEAGDPLSLDTLRAGG